MIRKPTGDWYTERPPTSELDAMERVIKLHYPWFYILWPICNHGHWMGQLGWVPEPFITFVEVKGKQATRCVRCKREADRRSAKRNRRKK